MKLGKQDIAKIIKLLILDFGLKEKSQIQNLKIS